MAQKQSVTLGKGYISIVQAQLPVVMEGSNAAALCGNPSERHSD